MLKAWVPLIVAAALDVALIVYITVKMLRMAHGIIPWEPPLLWLTPSLIAAYLLFVLNAAIVIMGY